jgi:hypothetical protein
MSDAAAFISGSAALGLQQRQQLPERLNAHFGIPNHRSRANAFAPSIKQGKNLNHS